MARLLPAGGKLVAVGEQTIASGMPTLPIWMAILGRAFFGVVLTRTIVAGTVIGFVAVLVVGGGGSSIPSVLAVLLSPVFDRSPRQPTAHAPRSPRSSTAMQMLGGSAVLFALVSGDIFAVRLADVVAAVGYLIGSLARRLHRLRW